LAIKNKEIYWVFKGKFAKGSEETPVCNHEHLCTPNLSGGIDFRGLAHKSYNLKQNSNIVYWLMCTIATTI